MLESDLNKIYQKIAEKVDEIIPIKWNAFYLNGEVDKKEGGVFFFFNTSDELDQYIYSHEIPDIFNVSEDDYDTQYIELFNFCIELQEKFIEYGQEPWYSFDMILQSNGKLNIHYGYTQWNKSDYGPTDRINYFQYKYLNRAFSNGKEKKKFEEMKKYENNTN